MCWATENIRKGLLPSVRKKTFIFCIIRNLCTGGNRVALMPTRYARYCISFAEATAEVKQQAKISEELKLSKEGGKAFKNVLVQTSEKHLESGLYTQRYSLLDNMTRTLVALKCYLAWKGVYISISMGILGKRVKKLCSAEAKKWCEPWISYKVATEER